MTITFGIDPGFTGAIACVVTGHKLLGIIDTPLIKGSGKVKDEIDILAIRTFLEDCLCFGQAQVFIEKVSAMPGQGVTSAFRFGQAYGIVLAVSLALGLPTRLVTPQAWRGAAGLAKHQNKGDSRVLAARLFPKEAHFFSRVKDDGRAEATLIAVAGQRLTTPVSHGTQA